MERAAIKELIKSTYDSIASSYQETYSEIDAMDRTKYWKVFTEICKGKRVLDMGCGDGDGTLFLLKKRNIPIGIDFSHAMIEIANKKSKDIEWVEGDICNCPFSDSFFSGIVLSYTINHLTDEMLIMVKEEIDRLLDKEGTLLLAFHVGEGEEIIKDPVDENLEIYYHYYTKERITDVFNNYLELAYFQRHSMNPAELMHDKAFFTLQKISNCTKEG